MNYPSPDNFEVIYVDCNEDLTWDVIGLYKGHHTVILPGLANAVIAHSFRDMYVNNYVREQFFSDGPSDC